MTSLPVIRIAALGVPVFLLDQRIVSLRWYEWDPGHGCNLAYVTDSGSEATDDWFDDADALIEFAREEFNVGRSDWRLAGQGDTKSPP